MSKMDELMEELRSPELTPPIWFEDGTLRFIDQRKLPFAEEVRVVDNIGQLAEAIREMMIRGSGAIGISGAWGVYLAALNSHGDNATVREAGELLKSTRPTAVNLMKTVDETLEAAVGDGAELVERIEEKVAEILRRQLSFERKLGEHGAALIRDGETIMTHCHSGALAGSGYGGRVFSVIRTAFEQGKDIRVLVSETRPSLQGARITAYEMKKFGIPYNLITDNMSGYCMSQGMIDRIVVGSDRVARNGDLANKVGTYMHALAAREHDVPFYTATSSHTVDFDTPSGEEIEVETRKSSEVTCINGRSIAPEGTEALYPSFDITPHWLLTGIITENGVIEAPFEKNLAALDARART
jgi:methylthioribose-1-phosphate isomerase